MSTPSRIELALMATSLALLILAPASCILRRCWRLRRRPAVSFFDVSRREVVMITGYTIFRPDGSQERGQVDWPDNPSYELIRTLVEPIVEGPMEHGTVLDPAKVDADEVDPAADRRDLFIDEIGHMRKTPRPRNEAATRIYRANWMRAHPGYDPEGLPWIAGTAVLFDRIVWR